MAEPEAGPPPTGRSVATPQLCALTDSVVVFDGRRLRQWADPFTSAAAGESRWTVLPRPVDDPLVSLTGVRRSAPAAPGAPELLFAVSASGRWEGWRHDPTGPGPRWERYVVPPPPVEAVAVAAWATPDGPLEVVLATVDGRLAHGDLTTSASTWTEIGRAPRTVALDVLVHADGAVELFALDADGEVSRRLRPAPGDPWAGVEVVASWTEPVVAFTSWSSGGTTEEQAALLDHGVVRQHWRRTGTVTWSDWWDAPSTEAPGVPAGLAALTSADEQLLVLLTGSATVSVRRWVSGGGWRPWSTPVFTPDPPSDPASNPASNPTSNPTSISETVLDGASAAAPTERVAPGAPADDRTTVLPAVPLADGPPTAATTQPRSQPRGDAVTVLFTDRLLSPLEPGDPTTIGSFKLQARIPGGQRGTVKYLARNGRGYCFLKVLQPAASPAEVSAFVRETDVARRVVERVWLTTYLDHREAGPDGPAYLALSYVPGQHLGDRIDRRPLTGKALVGFAAQLLEALDELADCRLLHLDLKPANIILRDGDHPMVVDFGSAVLDHVRQLPQVFTTRGYAAPELESGVVGPTTDLYAWGAVVVAAATGAAPAEDAESRTAQLDRLPTTLRALVTDALATEPADRPALADARRRLASSLGPRTDLIDVRLAVDDDAPRVLPVVVRTTPRRLVERAAALSPWRYRGVAGLAALAGSVVGLLLGTFMITFFRAA